MDMEKNSETAPVKPLPLVKIIFEDEATGKTCALLYELFENSFTRKWLKLLRTAIKSDSAFWGGGHFYGKVFQSEVLIVKQMKRVIKILNAHGADHINLVPHLGMSRQFLNSMHDRFEALDNSGAYYRGSVPDPVFEALHQLNSLVHRAEQFLVEDDGFHVDVCWSQSFREPFTPEDYRLFTPDLLYGQLYLAYGLTGVPFVNAFHANSADARAQDSFTPSMVAWFCKDNPFQEWDQLKKWLKEKHNRDIDDPALALGYIPLGKLARDYGPLEKVAKRQARYTKVKAVKLLKARPKPVGRRSKAAWPFLAEIFHHLDLIPYINLDYKFDFRGCHEEASKLIKHFVKHRDYDQSSSDGAAWKSLAIHALNGNSAKTQHHFDYGVKDPEYRLSEIADLCPKTLNFLRDFTDISSCHRIRFMLLEPGARIKVHSDAPNKPVSIAINIALNMPRGCDFYLDVNSDGSHSPYTKKVPFVDGSIMLINNAKYHYLENNSSTPRLHLIIHGPLIVDDATIVQRARDQNGLHSEKEVVRELVKKYAALGKPLDSSTPLFQSWKTHGLSSESIPESIRLVVLDDEIPQSRELQEECLHKITCASLFPLAYRVIKGNQLDSWLARDVPQGTEAVVIISAGTLITDMFGFIANLLLSVSELKRQDGLVSGHIMDWQKQDGCVPYLHEQFAILNYSKWKNGRGVPFGIAYRTENILFPGYLASAECVHDNYTPLRIDPAPDKVEKEGKNWWGTQLVAETLKSGIPVHNISTGLRKAKMYAYPKAEDHRQYFEVKQHIARSLAGTRDAIFYFNNEPLEVARIDGFEPVHFLSVAAGLKPAAIINQYWPGRRQPSRVTLIDYSRIALEYLANLSTAADELDLAKLIHSFMTRRGGDSTPSLEHVRGTLRAQIREWFSDDFSSLRQPLAKLSHGRSFNSDFIEDHHELLTQFKPGEKFLMWHSNAWYCNPVYFKYTRPELEENYVGFGKKVGERLGLNVWKHKSRYQMVVGTSLSELTGLLTDGGPGLASLQPKDYWKL